jgi:hypothetical protein
MKHKISQKEIRKKKFSLWALTLGKGALFQAVINNFKVIFYIRLRLLMVCKH